MARGERFITSNLVVGETYTLLCTRLGYHAAGELLDRTRASTRLEIIFISPDLEEAAYALLQRYRDQPFSFIHGTSFVLMKTCSELDDLTYLSSIRCARRDYLQGDVGTVTSSACFPYGIL